MTSCPSGLELGNEQIAVRGKEKKEEEIYCKYIHVENGVGVTAKVAGQSDRNKSHRKCEA